MNTPTRPKLDADVCVFSQKRGNKVEVLGDKGNKVLKHSFMVCP